MSITMTFHQRSLAIVLFSIILSSCGPKAATQQALQSDLSALASTSAETFSANSSGSNLTGSFKADLARAVGIAPDYLAAQSAVTEAAHGVDVARSVRRPQIELNGNVGALREVGQTKTTNTEGASASVYLRQVVYDGGESVANIDKATATLLGAQSRADEEGNRIARDAGSAWIDLWQYRQRRALLDERAQKARDMISQMQQLISSGVIDKSVTMSAEITMRDLELERTNLNASYLDAEARFANYFGKSPKAVNTPNIAFSQQEFARVASDWGSVPMLQSAAARVIAAQKDLAGAEARMKPTAGFRTGVNSPMSTNSSTDYAVGIELRWILGDGGRRKADIQARSARLATEKSALEAIKLRGKAELDRALAKRAALATSLEILRAQENATNEENSVLWSQLSTGQSSMRQLVDAEIQAYKSSDRLIAARAEAMKLDLEIAAQTGILLDKLGLMQQPKGGEK